MHTGLDFSLFRRSHCLYLQCRRSIASNTFKHLNISQISRSKSHKRKYNVSNVYTYIHVHMYIYAHIYTFKKYKFMNKLKRSLRKKIKELKYTRNANKLHNLFHFCKITAGWDQHGDAN